MKKTVLIGILLLVTITMNMMAQTKVIAHRGFWKTKGSAQNSVAALIKADSIGCYGSEFDVRLTADNHLIVCHDSWYKFRRIKTSNIDQLTSLQLSNGEQIPSLEDYLKMGKELPSIRLILELKKLLTPEHEEIAITKILKLVSQYQLEDRIDYISFSLHAVKEFIRLSPTSPVYYLEGDLTPKELKAIGVTGLNYPLNSLKKHPEWINEAHELGLKVNVWTVNKEKDMKWLIEQGVDFITTDEPILLQQVLAN